MAKYYVTVRTEVEAVNAHEAAEVAAAALRDGRTLHCSALRAGAHLSTELTVDARGRGHVISERAVA